MREIIFRGKRIDNGEWVEGYLCKKFFQEVPHDRYLIMYKTEYDTKRWQPDYMTAEIDPETVGQYTGLTDRNNKKIFEGDIVTMPAYGGGRHKSIVYFKGGKFAVDGSNYSFKDIAPKYMEVISNIHDNPELLKGGAKMEKK